MKLSAYSLKTGIFATLVFVLLLAMLLLDIVMIKMAEQDMVNAEKKKGILLLRTIEQTLLTGLKGQTEDVLDTASPFFQGLHHVLDTKSLSGVLLINDSGATIFETQMGEGDRGALSALAVQSLRTQKDLSDLSTRGAFPFLPLKRGHLLLATPIVYGKRVIGAASVQIPLHGMYSTIRQSQKVVLFYVLLNTLFLALFGFYLLYRSIIRPINRLVRRAEEFKEGETFLLSSETRHNEFGKLSRAVNMTLRGLEDSKAELRESIESLENTNRELRQAQEELVRSEKLASVGRLASGVAHEIGNPIGIVLGYLDLLKGSDLKKSEQADFIARIEKEIDRVNRTIGNLLDFSRPSKGEVKAVSVQQIIDDTLDILKPQPMMTDIRVVVDREAAQDTVLADPDKLKQVFLNIAMNALDAMAANQTKHASDSKQFSIITRLVSESGSGTSGSTTRVHVDCIDNGPGISAKDLSRIFDPFYTTKEPGKGTGLGLSVSLRIVEDMGGDIKVRSDVGKGTTMTVILPLYES
ncbi:MAG: HAMP domain-containing protein [Deltaproteobacteria bacterium]|nr:HAMP domain-containing protein [Deltaproteobacteria bacterium]MBW2339240.1 HAMP domain-containing protein [Deltaproteobacteria bacterium]